MGTTQRVTAEYAAQIARTAYLWGWPLVNMHNRRVFMEQLPEPGLMAGIVPAGPPNHFGMLHDYIRPEERVVACPNQDVAYGFGTLDAELGPAVVQVPDFGDRFWVYQVVNQRTDSFGELGKMSGTKPGHYLLAPESWAGDVPDGIVGVFRYDTRSAVVIPRVFLDDTAEDRAAIGSLVNQQWVSPDTGARLDGTRAYSVRFEPGRVPPVHGFWSLTVYNKHHFFHPNDLDRFSLGTKNKNLTFDADGALTMTVGGTAPNDPALLVNWLPAPEEEFSLFLRAYWPDDAILNGSWTPPAVMRR